MCGENNHVQGTPRSATEQRFAYCVDRLDYKHSKNFQNKPSLCKNGKKQETIPMWPGKGTCKEVWPALSQPWYFAVTEWIQTLLLILLGRPLTLRGQRLALLLKKKALFCETISEHKYEQQNLKGNVNCISAFTPVMITLFCTKDFPPSCWYKTANVREAQETPADTYPAHRPPSHSGQGFKSTERQKIIENSQRPRTEFQSRPRHTAQLAQPSPQGQLGKLQPARSHTQHQGQPSQRQNHQHPDLNPGWGASSPRCWKQDATGIQLRAHTNREWYALAALHSSLSCWIIPYEGWTIK